MGALCNFLERVPLEISGRVSKKNSITSTKVMKEIKLASQNGVAKLNQETMSELITAAPIKGPTIQPRLEKVITHPKLKVFSLLVSDMSAIEAVAITTFPSKRPVKNRLINKR